VWRINLRGGEGLDLTRRAPFMEAGDYAEGEGGPYAGTSFRVKRPVVAAGGLRWLRS